MRNALVFTASLLAFPAIASAAPAVSVPGNAVSQAATASAQTITLEARQLQGSEAVNVTGTAAPGSAVTLTLTALISTDLPTVLVSRHDVVADVNGRFGAIIPIASAYERGMLLTVYASSGPGVGGARAQLTTSAPNAGAIVPLEQL